MSWRIRTVTTKDSNSIVICTAEGDHVATVGHDRQDRKTVCRNAKLIADAPLLLELLRGLCTHQSVNEQIHAFNRTVELLSRHKDE